MTRYNIALVNGDGIGPELAAAAAEMLEYINDHSSAIKFSIQEVKAGDNALAKYNSALPSETLDIIKKSNYCIKPPVGETAADVIIVLRKLFDLYANVRPAKSFPNIQSISSDVDLVIVRENTEDLYLGWEFNADDRTVISLRKVSEQATRRIADYAFRISRQRNNKRKVIAVHKANVLRLGDRLFASTCRKVAQDYPDIDFSEMYVDACAMNIIRNPEEFDVVLTSNLFGDILSDESAQVIGGLGLAPSANIGDNFALFEPVHGAAFDIAGKNIANPTSIILSIKMMLDHISEKSGDKEASKIGVAIENSIAELLKDNQKTKDIGGNLGTKEFTKKIIGEMVKH